MVSLVSSDRQTLLLWCECLHNFCGDFSWSLDFSSFEFSLLENFFQLATCIAECRTGKEKNTFKTKTYYVPTAYNDNEHMSYQV